MFLNSFKKILNEIQQDFNESEFTKKESLIYYSKEFKFILVIRKHQEIITLKNQKKKLKGIYI